MSFWGKQTVHILFKSNMTFIAIFSRQHNWLKTPIIGALKEPLIARLDCIDKYLEDVSFHVGIHHSLTGCCIPPVSPNPIESEYIIPWQGPVSHLSHPIPLSLITRKLFIQFVLRFLHLFLSKSKHGIMVYMT